MLPLVYRVWRVRRSAFPSRAAFAASRDLAVRPTVRRGQREREAQMVKRYCQAPGPAYGAGRYCARKALLLVPAAPRCTKPPCLTVPWWGSRCAWEEERRASGVREVDQRRRVVRCTFFVKSSDSNRRRPSTAVTDVAFVIRVDSDSSRTSRREVLRDDGYRTRDCLEGRGGGASLAAASRHVDTKERLVTERERGGEERRRGERET